MTIQLFAWVLMNGVIVAATGAASAVEPPEARGAASAAPRGRDHQRQEALDVVNQRVAELDSASTSQSDCCGVKRQPVPRPET
jgi:hypothetical protein